MDEQGDDNLDTARLESWVRAANAWGEAAQILVGAAANLTLASRSLADALESSGVDRMRPGDPQRNALGESLRTLGEEVESESKELRDRFLATEANLAEYREILDRR